VVRLWNWQDIDLGKFDKRFSAVIRQSFTIRNRSDYEDFYIVAKEDVIQQMNNAKEFMAVVTTYIDCLDCPI